MEKQSGLDESFHSSLNIIYESSESIYSPVIQSSREVNGLNRHETVRKYKIWAVVAWTILYLVYFIWGNQYPEPAGLATDAGGYLYTSCVDTYRDEVRLQKLTPRGRVIWSRIYQGKHISHWENENVVVAPSGVIYQIISKLWENSSSLTVLCYDATGKRKWLKDLYGVPYYKEKTLDGDDLVIAGLDKNGGSFKIIRIAPNGNVAAPAYLYNPLAPARVSYRVVNKRLALLAGTREGMKLSMVDSGGKVTAAWNLQASRLLGAAPDESLFLAREPEGIRIDKYSPTGTFLWSQPVGWFKPQPQIKPVIKAEHLEVDSQQNLYVTGKAQFYSSNPDYFLRGYYNKGKRYRFDKRSFYRTRGGDRIFIAKFDAQGRRRWTRYFVTYQSNPVPRGIAADQQGNVYVSGNFNLLNSSQNAFTAKYSPQGKQLWVKRIFTLPPSLFYIGLFLTLLMISLSQKDRGWKAELTILTLLVVLLWGLEIF